MKSNLSRYKYSTRYFLKYLMVPASESHNSHIGAVGLVVLLLFYRKGKLKVKEATIIFHSETAINKRAQFCG